MKYYRYSIFSIYFFTRKKYTIVSLYISFFCFMLKSWLKSFRYLQIFYIIFILYILFFFLQILVEIVNYCWVITSTLYSISLNFDEKFITSVIKIYIYIKIERKYSKKWIIFWILGDFFFYNFFYIWLCCACSCTICQYELLQHECITLEWREDRLREPLTIKCV